MIKGSGIDIIEIDRIRKAINNNNRFMERIFSENELSYINSRNNNVNTIAGLFAAKEAVSKALGSGISGFKWTDIEVFSEKSGKPSIRLFGMAKELAEKEDISNIHISISHSKDNAVAFAIAEKGIDELKKLNAHILYTKEDYSFIDKDMVASIIPERKKNTHKGTYGKVGIVGGSKGMTGAVALALKACLRSGSGLVYSIVPEPLDNILESLVLESVTYPISCNNEGHFNKYSIDEIKDFVDKLDTIVLGPGMGVDKERIELVKDILLHSHKPIVLDADGINCISKSKEVLKQRRQATVISPHPGELSRLLDVNIKEIQSDRIKYCSYAAKRFNSITVLKGSNTVIASPDGDIFVNSTGNPGMATAGSGDVLSGIIGSLIGQKIQPLEATIAGVFLHGLAGDLGAKDKGEYGLIAGDIIENLPYAIKLVKSS